MLANIYMRNSIQTDDHTIIAIRCICVSCYHYYYHKHTCYHCHYYFYYSYVIINNYSDNNSNTTNNDTAIDNISIICELLVFLRPNICCIMFSMKSIGIMQILILTVKIHTLWTV